MPEIADRWSSPSPCEDWTAHAVVQHFLGLIGGEFR
jgi:hypothetical protein